MQVHLKRRGIQKDTRFSPTLRVIAEDLTNPITVLRQEPAITACVSDDAKMIDAFVHDLDIYAVIASVAFNRDYLDCLGPENMPPDCGRAAHPEGKKYRGKAKAIVLGEPKGFSSWQKKLNAPLYSNIH